MYIAHGPISYLVNEKIQKKEISKLDENRRILISLLSIFFGILPDFDIFLYVMRDIPVFLHHSMFTHSLTFWVCIWILFQFLLLIVKKYVKRSDYTLLTIINNSLLIGTASHLLADSIFTHVRLFFPLESLFTIFGNIVESNLFAGYLYSISMAIEVLILILFASYIYRTFFRPKRIFNYVFYISALIYCLYLILTIFFTVNTYNVSTNTLENGRKTIDQDYDSVRDKSDPDTNNNLTNNIEDTDYNLLSEDVLKIINTKSITSTKNDLFFRFGAFNSYRLISQAYFEQNKPIEPVLEEYARTKYNISKYDIDIKYSELLFSYFNEKNLLFTLDTIQSESLTSGKFLFIQDKEGKLRNMGIILKDNSVGIVFDNDRRLKIHSISEVLITYEEYTLYIQI